MEYRNVAALFQLALDFKAARCRNVLQIDAAKGTGNQCHGVDKFIDILGLDAKRECIDAAELLEQRALAFHNRHACFRTNIAQTKHSRTIGDNCHQIMTARIHIAQIYILLNFQTRLCNARRVCNRQIIRIFYLAARNNFDLALPITVGL